MHTRTPMQAAAQMALHVSLQGQGGLNMHKGDEQESQCIDFIELHSEVCQVHDGITYHMQQCRLAASAFIAKAQRRELFARATMKAACSHRMSLHAPQGVCNGREASTQSLLLHKDTCALLHTKLVKRCRRWRLSWSTLGRQFEQRCTLKYYSDHTVSSGIGRHARACCKYLFEAVIG